MNGPRLRESAIQSAVLAHWRALACPGTFIAAIPNQYAHGQPGLTAGLPDLLVIAPDLGVGFIELKAKDGRESQAQKDFAAYCARRGIPHATTYGRDEPIAVLERWGVVRPAVASTSA